ncbi:MAG: hypothetical protein OXC30_01155 [Alphaproteobacteria bacterium]|nr:hypothetical protein [Alphaproteobacteria bacterium]
MLICVLLSWQARSAEQAEQREDIVGVSLQDFLKIHVEFSSLVYSVMIQISSSRNAKAMEYADNFHRSFFTKWHSAEKIAEEVSRFDQIHLTVREKTVASQKYKFNADYGLGIDLQPPLQAWAVLHKQQRQHVSDLKNVIAAKLPSDQDYIANLEHYLSLVGTVGECVQELSDHMIELQEQKEREKRRRCQETSVEGLQQMSKALEGFVKTHKDFRCLELRVSRFVDALLVRIKKTESALMNDKGKSLRVLFREKLHALDSVALKINRFNQWTVDQEKGASQECGSVEGPIDQDGLCDYVQCFREYLCFKNQQKQNMADFRIFLCSRLISFDCWEEQTAHLDLYARCLRDLTVSLTILMYQLNKLGPSSITEIVYKEGGFSDELVVESEVFQRVLEESAKMSISHVAAGAG